MELPLQVNFRLIVWDIDEEAGTKSVRDIKEQEVYMGDIPFDDKKCYICELMELKELLLARCIDHPG